MKILHLCDSLNPAGLGGYESYLYYLSEQLAKRGHESVVVTQSPSHNSPNTIEFEHYRVYHLPGNFLEARKWEFLALPEDERETIVEHMFQSDDLELNVKALQEQLKNLIIDLKPDLIHAHSVYVVFNRVLQGFLEDGVLDDLPTVVTIHGRPKPLILPGGEKTTDYDAFVDSCPFSLILAVSNNVAEVLRDYLSRKGLDIPVQTLYLGINLSVFSPQTEVTKKWDVAFLGRLETMKAVDLFPKMLSSLKPDFPKLKFLMTGEGSYKDKLLRGFDNEGVTEMVDYLGVVETERVPDLINQSRIFIYPSREEPFGLS
ncbi:MAG: glycosyltransferase, partial [Candidatus Thorarchaeota archaeon]